MNSIAMSQDPAPAGRVSRRAGAGRWTRSGTDAAGLDGFQRERERLLRIAGRMLGSPREAEDVLQDAYLRWHRVEHAQVENTAGFLTRMVTRLSLNALQTAHHRRIRYTGLELPQEPSDVHASPAALYERADELEGVVRLLLQRLTPAERAVFLLREGFDYSYAEIADVMGKTEENCRQIERRARLGLTRPRRVREVDPQHQARLLAAFLRASREGEMAPLLELLTGDLEGRLVA